MNKKVVLLSLAVLTVIIPAIIIGSEYYASQPQFCGVCHTMEKPYDLWAKSGHRDIKCIDCHFASGKESFLTANFRGLQHFFGFLSAPVDAAEDQKLSIISTPGCTTSGCHIGEKFPESKVNQGENMPSNHKPHEDRIIEGAALNCGTCHFDIKSVNDHAVSQEACYLCLALTHIHKVAID